MTKMNWDPVTHYQNKVVAENYDKDRFASCAGKIFNALEKRYVRRAFAAVPRHGTVLDMPCGTGRLAEVLLQEGFYLVGVDISPVMLEVAQRRLKRFGRRFQTELGNAFTKGECTDRAYDAALCARVLMHFPLEEQIAFLRGVASRTRGPVIITHSLDTRYQRLRRRLKRFMGHPAPVAYPVREGDVAKLLAGAGLREVKRLRPFPLLTEEVIVIARPVEG